VSKRQQIEAFLKEGKSYREIATIIGSSRSCVANVAADLRTGAITFASRRYGTSEKVKERKRKSPKRQLYRRKMLNLHQDQTRPLVSNNRQEWTTKDLEYLERYGKEQTIHELALKLGRSYLAIQMSAVKHGIDLRGNKVGVGSARFRGSYNKQSLVETKTNRHS